MDDEKVKAIAAESEDMQVQRTSLDNKLRDRSQVAEHHSSSFPGLDV